MLIILLRGLGLAAQEVGLLIVHEEDKEEAVAHIQLKEVRQLSFHSLKRREVGIYHEQRTLGEALTDHGQHVAEVALAETCLLRIERVEHPFHLTVAS